MRTRAMVLLALGLPACAAGAPDGVRRFDGMCPLEWSERMADSEIGRLGTSLEAGGTDPAARWDYSTGVLAFGMVRLGEATGRDTYTRFGTRAVASHVNADGTIQGYAPGAHALDDIEPGKVLLEALDRGVANGAYVGAVRALEGQIAAQPRTREGGYWHKGRYPSQIWLDGLYMAAPFLAQYAAHFREPSLFPDVARQIILADRHAYDPSTGLYWHGWDESRTQAWADKVTGDSPSFWSRSIGWYAMAIVDASDYLPPDLPENAQIRDIFRRLAAGAVRWQDPATGAWWQVTNFGGRKGNYLEASGSAMFAYALAKGVNKGLLPRERYLPAITRAYAGVIGSFVVKGRDGRISLTGICRSAGLGSDPAGGRVRDGSFDYYVSEPVVENDPKGTGPFILAGIEVQKLQEGGSAPGP